MPARLPRVVAAATGAFAGLVLLATPALAHVTVHSSDATQGGYAEITFRIPTEEDVPTTQVQVVLPENAPLASVSVKPHPGWTWTTTTAKPATPLTDDDGPVDQVVTAITWTATDGGIKPGEFDDFDISAGPLPKATSITFKALQTYADGSVVRWIEEAPAGGAEPEHPAPVLQLTADAAPEPVVSATPIAAVPAASATSTTTSSSSNKGLSISALAVAVVAAGLGLGALLRSGRRSPST